jgi:hypothetical protein
VKCSLLIIFFGISTFGFSQKKWHPTIATYITMDAAGTYIDPSIAAGIEKIVKNNNLGVNVHYFVAIFKRKIYLDTGTLRMLAGSIYVENFIKKIE